MIFNKLLLLYGALAGIALGKVSKVLTASKKLQCSSSKVNSNSNILEQEKVVMFRQQTTPVESIRMSFDGKSTLQSI